MAIVVFGGIKKQEQGMLLDRRQAPVTLVRNQANLRCNTRACRVKLALVMHRDTLSIARPVGG